MSTPLPDLFDAEQSSPVEPPERSLQRIVAYLLPIFTGFTLLYGVLFSLSGMISLALTGLVTMAYGVVLLLAQHALRRARVTQAVALLCSGMLIAALVTVWVHPSLFATLAVVPVLAVAVALPTTAGPTLRRLAALCWLVTTGVAAVGVWMLPTTRSDWVTAILQVTTLSTSLGIAFGLLVQFRTRLSAMLRAAQLGNDRLSALQHTLAVQHARLQVTLQSITDAVITTDGAGRVLLMNRAAGELSLVPPEVAIGQPLAVVLPLIDPATHQKIHDLAVAVATTGTATELRTPCLLPQVGTDERWVVGSVAPLHGTADAPSGTIVALREVTAVVVAERVQQATEVALRETQKLESLGVLAGGVAHDFNNFLQAISGHAELAELALADVQPHPAVREAQDALRVVHQTAQRAAELTQQLLAYTGKGTLQITNIDLNSVITEMTSLLHTSIPKGVVLRLSLASQPLLVEGDVSQVRQVVMNLVLNAAEAIADEGAVTLTTRSVTLDAATVHAQYHMSSLAPGRYIACTVHDTGRGMDAATLARIYEPFFTTKFTGRGLGLAAVQGIMRRHSGGIHVRSAPGMGSTFTVLLPQRAGAVPSPTPRTQSTTRQLQGQVLVIDDEADIRTMVSALLTRWGLTVTTAVDGADGSQAVSKVAADCILLDVTMPHGGAAVVLDAVMQRCPSVPVILMSGYSEHDALAAVSGFPIAGFVQKPFVVATLRESLEPLLAHNREGRAVRI